LGEHTGEILNSILGLDDDEIEAARKDGAIWREEYSGSDDQPQRTQSTQKRIWIRKGGFV